MDKSTRTRDIFLSGISLAYVFAFGSLFPQIPGLYGRNGIIPVTSTIQSHAQAGRSHSAEKLFSEIPTLIYFLPLEPEHTMELFCIIGTFLGILSSIFQTWRNSFVYFFMYALYLSVFKVGSTFLWFQWDTLLLEAGFISIILAPMTMLSLNSKRISFHKQLPWFLVRWLLFRLMFASGVVKLTSGCPTWWKLTALNYHYESQCLPTPLAWWVHQFPDYIHKMSVIGTYIIEIGFPLLFFSPVRSWRKFAGYAQIMLMFFIILTGNYNFFNYLTMVLSLSLLDDESMDGIISKLTLGLLKKQNQQQQYVEGGKMNLETNNPGKTLNKKNHKVLLCSSLISVAVLFSISRRLFYSKGQLILNFTMEDLNLFLEMIIPVMMWVSGLWFLYTVLKLLYKNLMEFSGSLSLWIKLENIIKCLLLISPCVFLFAVSMVPFLTLLPEHDHHDNVWPLVQQWYKVADKYEITHSYGLFRRMTGVGGRPEVVIEASNKFDGPWKELNFKYKPGHLKTAPLWAAPHQPRLDWQLWFAALGSYQHNPWFVSLIHRILIGQKEGEKTSIKCSSFVNVTGGIL